MTDGFDRTGEAEGADISRGAFAGRLASSSLIGDEYIGFMSCSMYPILVAGENGSPLVSLYALLVLTPFTKPHRCQVERSVEDDYIANLRMGCYRERNQKVPLEAFPQPIKLLDTEESMIYRSIGSTRLLIDSLLPRSR